MLLIKQCCYVGRKYMYQLKYQWRVNYITNNSDNRFSCHKSPRICSTCRKYFLVLTSFMTYHRVCNQINTTSATSGARTIHLPEHLRLRPVSSDVRVTRTLVLSVCFVDRCWYFFLLAILCCLSFDLQILITSWYRLRSIIVVVSRHIQYLYTERCRLSILTCGQH